MYSQVDRKEEENARRIPLIGSKKLIYPLLLAVPIVFGFVLPVSQLLYWAYFTFATIFNEELLWIALQSFGVAFVAAFSIIVIALALVYFSRWSQLRGFDAFKKIASIGYVIPGAIIGIGIIRSSQSIVHFFNNNLGIEVGFLFYSSSIVLIYAYMFRFMAVGFNPLEASSLKLGKHLSESAYLLGSGKFAALFRIELPLLRNTIVSAFLLVFIDVLKELPLTLILKPYNLQTLAINAYAYAEDERVPEAAIPALLLIGVITLLMIVLKYGERKLLARD